MKNKLGKLCIALVAGAVMTFQSAKAEDLVVAVDTAFMPFEFKQDGEYVGFDIDLWDAVAKDLGVSYRLQPMDFNGIIPALQTKQVDVALAGITITEERAQVVDFSDGYYNSGLMIMVKSDNDTINEPADLEGKTIAVKTGTASPIYARDNFKDVTLRQFPNIDNAYLEVRLGRVDAAMHDTPNVLYYIKSTGDDAVKTIGGNLEATQYGIAFPKGSDLVAQVNQSLQNIKENGTYETIYEKWFGVKPQ